MNRNDSPQSGNLALKSGAWYVASSIMVKAVSIITTPIFTRLLSKMEYGAVATFTSWYSLLAVFCTLNLTYSIGRAKLDMRGDLGNYIGSMQLLSGLVSFAILAVSVIFINPVSSFLELSKSATILLVVYLFFGSSISFYQNGFRYRYKYKQNIAVAWYTALATVFFSLLFVLSHDTNRDEWRMLGITLPTVLLSSSFWIHAIRHKRLVYNKEYWRYGLALSLPLILHTLSLNLLSQSDRIFISKICGTEDTALYSLVYNYSLLLSIVMNAIADGWLPWFHDNYFAGNNEMIKKSSKKLVVLGCYIGLGCIAVAPEAIAVLGGKDYLPGLPCVLPIVLGVVCQYIYTHYVNIEMHLKKTKYVSEGTIFATVLNLILNAIFIPMFGFVVAAYTTLVSYLALMIVHFVITRKKLGVKLYDDAFMFGIMIGTSAVGFIVTLVYDYMAIRYGLTAIGFVTFLVYFREYIKQAIDKAKAGN
ncbi:polysaccharide biosynthesis protein [Clostridiales bacterium 1_7_47FAA]|uniref:Oligosaccharide flippase family protein n=1 Tax=Enterocloster hominis (ex Hitch et al. 2024) TaxID=1917870 RepID=A0ABV1DD14_9FIRM|nr:polysaccharide biosynthesis protein [Clostridiales bacterium 1_7_47FAA]